MEQELMLQHDHLNIPCKISEPDSGTIRRVVMGVHGFGGSMDDAIQVAIAEEMELFYAATIRFDFPAHGKNPSSELDLQDCLDTLTREVDAHQKAATDALDDMLFKERTLILIAILATLFTMLLTTLLVVSPLLRAVVYIRADQPIPIKGSNEFQFLAKTYNLMYEANQEKAQRLTYDATHDQLTGIHNRSGYVFFLRNTNWESSALLLFDVDKFKQINDGHGHELGDKALVRVAGTILKCFRSQDHVCRIGGDEFAVIMVHTDCGHTGLVKQKVARINEILGRGEDGLPPISLSCGVAFGDERQDAEDIFKRADAALYAVKTAGGHDCQIGE
jgi:diguanylate cyclase (GGDEF)-like protein